MPSREIFWNIQFGELVYLIGPIVILLAVFGLYRRLRLWRLGSKDDRLNNLPSRVWTFSSRPWLMVSGTGASSVPRTRE